MHGISVSGCRLFSVFLNLLAHNGSGMDRPSWCSQEENYVRKLIHVMNLIFYVMGKLTYLLVGLGGLGVTCSPRDPRFVDSNLVEVDGFFRT